MRNIVLARVDDRLIHGEVVTAWTPNLSANRIVVIDDTVANDKFNKRLLQLLAPAGTKIEIYGLEEAVDKLNADFNEKERLLLLAKTPVTYEELIKRGVGIKDVNLGGMGIRGERKPFIKNVSCDESEVDSIRRMTNNGVHVYYQLVPEQKVIELTDLL